jgi:hypothetical protein
VQSIREANSRAQRFARHARRRRTVSCVALRIARFSEFVEQIAGLLETFASLGAGPMMTALRMMSKMRAPRLVRI